LGFRKQAQQERIRAHYGVRRIRDAELAAQPGHRCVSFENYTLYELVRHFERGATGAMRDFLEMYDVRRTFPDMSNFRMGPNMFGETALDWIAFHTAAQRESDTQLVAHGITTRLRWNEDPATLPRGWIGAIRQSYEESILRSETPTTLVGLLILVDPAFREYGWAAQVVTEMKRLAVESGLRDLIIPLRLPTRYALENVAMPYEEFALQKRDDGQYRDHWLRLHVRLGAEVIGVCAVSHQHAMHPADLAQQVECKPLERTGEYVVKWNEEYYHAHVDLERGFSLINQGCVWVRHGLS
ncbi:MAG: hypothetical protein JO359_07550, partial [Candidatus Eremiobacteraeota bacterium]|nr:hypothetical protein [Candidatus Eremiobacteraeota bacterium]